MKRVLFIGFDPATVDFSDPALPPGMTVEKIKAGIEVAMADFAAAGLGRRTLLYQARRDRGANRRKLLSATNLRLRSIGCGCSPTAKSIDSVRGCTQRHPPRGTASSHRVQHTSRR